MVNSPNISLKIIILVHFTLTIWASMATSFLPPAYAYMNAFIIAIGVWSLICPESVEAMMMFLTVNVLSILLDIIFLGIFVPLGHDFYETDGGRRMVNTYRFCLGMAIVNLIIKPFTSFVLYRMYQDRGGNYSDFGIGGGIPGIPNLGGNSGQGHGYENIDQPIPGNSVETASPHQFGGDKPPLTP